MYTYMYIQEDSKKKTEVEDTVFLELTENASCLQTTKQTSANCKGVEDTVFLELTENASCLQTTKQTSANCKEMLQPTLHHGYQSPHKVIKKQKEKRFVEEKYHPDNFFIFGRSPK